MPPGGGSRRPPGPPTHCPCPSRNAQIITQHLRHRADDRGPQNGARFMVSSLSSLSHTFAGFRMPTHAELVHLYGGIAERALASHHAKKLAHAPKNVERAARYDVTP